VDIASLQEIAEEQRRDIHIGPIIEWITENIRPDWSEVSSKSKTTKAYWAQWDSLCLRNGALYRKWESSDGNEVRLKLVVPDSMKRKILMQLHDHPTAGHFGVNKTVERVKQSFYWINCRSEVRLWCERCPLCCSRKGPIPRQKAALGKYVVGAPMERIAVDVMGPLTLSDRGNRYVLVAMDYFSKWPEAYALPAQDAKSVAEVLVNQFVSRFGVPLELHSDQGTNFESATFKEMCRILGIKKTRTTPLHPQSDGMVERYNRTLKGQIAMFVEDHQRDWDVRLPLLLMAYRTAVHSSTKHTPACLMMGRELRVPVDLTFGSPEANRFENYPQYIHDLQENLETVHEFARKNLEFNYDKMEARYNTDSNAGTLEEGSLVWLFNPRKKKGRSPKLARPWEGPYIVVKRINDLVYRIRRNPLSKPKVVHRNRLWKCQGSQSELWPDTNVISVQNGEDEVCETVDEMNDVAPREDSTLRRSKRKRTPRVVLDL
jgi:transposase InsO family protein